jgi:hypothetical protein
MKGNMQNMLENMQNMQNNIHNMQLNMQNNMEQYVQYATYANKPILHILQI